MKSYKGKTSLVTGASLGIGKALAEDLAARGSNLILVARSLDKLEALAASIRAQQGVRVDVIAADLAQAGATAKLFADVEAKGLKVDVLVNNAGFGKWGRFEDDDLATYGEMIDLNIRAVVDLCRLFMPGMAARGDCAVLNIGSTASFIPVPWASVYGATKAFVLSLSEALSYEYKGRGVQVTALCPGNTVTNFANVANAAADKSKDTGDSPEMVARTGLDALIKGRGYVISGNNKIVGFLPRLLSRQRVLSIAGETWKKRLRERGVTV